MGKRFSVIIPLYNKKKEIGDTILSVLAQSMAPHEIIVVDDGSTDGSAKVVEKIASPLVRLVRQDNAGECAARNRAIAEATGEYMALLDGDDTWQPQYLERVSALIDKYPGCGLYITGLNVVRGDKVYEADQPESEGIIEDFFREANGKFIGIPSCMTVPGAVFVNVGGFPDGMRLGGDQYMWVKIIDAGYRACYTPERLSNYSISASNRSSAIYKPEKTGYSLRSFYREGDFYRNEYLARIEINKAIAISVKGGTGVAEDVERFYSYTKLHKRALMRLKTLNNTPPRLRRYLDNLYKGAAWITVRKGY